MSASPANPVICVVTVDISVNHTEDVPIHLHDNPEAVAKAFSARHNLPAEIEAALTAHFSDNFSQAKARHDEALAAKRRLKSESTRSKHNRSSTGSSAFDLLQTTGTNEQLTASGATTSATLSAQAEGADSLAPRPAYSPIAAHGSSSASQSGFTLSSESASVVFGTAPLPASADPGQRLAQGEDRAEVKDYAGRTQPAALQKESENADADTNQTSSSRRMTGDSEELEAMYAQLINAEAAGAGDQTGGKRARAHTAGSIDIVPGRRSSGASSAGLCYTKEALMSASSQTGVAAKRQSTDSLSGPTVKQGTSRLGPGQALPSQEAGTAAASRKPPVARLPRVASLPPRAAAVPPPVPEVTVGPLAPAVARPETFQRLHQEAQARQARVKALADKVSISELQSINAARRRMSGHDLPAVPSRLQNQADAGSGPGDPTEASERLYAQAADLVTKRSKAAKALAIERAAVSEWMCPACCRPNSGRFAQCQQPSKGGKLHAGSGGRAGQGGKLCGAPRPAEENKPVISSFASRIHREMKANEPEYVDWSVAKQRDDRGRREAEAKQAAEEQLKVQATFKPVINPQSVQIAASFRDRRAQDVLPSGGASDVHSVLYAEGLKRMNQSHALQVSGTGASKVKEVSSDLFNRLYAEGEELQAKLQAARSKAEQEARVAAAGRAGRVLSLPAEEASKLYALAAEKAAEKQSKLHAQLEQVDDAARAKHTSSKSEVLLQGMRQKALAGVYQCLLQSIRHSSGSGQGNRAQATTQRTEAWSPGLLPQGQLDRLVCAIDVCGSLPSAGALPEDVQHPVPVGAAKLEALGDALLAAYVDKALQIMCCDKRGEQMTVSFEGFCGVLGRLVEDAGGGPHVYLHARKARKAAQVQRQIEETQRKEQQDLTFAPAIDARSVQLVQQARARQSRSRSSSAAPSQDPFGPTSEESAESPVDVATVQPVSRRSSAARSYAPTDAPAHVRAHAEVYAVADKRRAAELDALRVQLAQHPFAPVLGPAGASAHNDAHPDQRTLQASKLQAAQLAARAKAVMRSKAVQQQAADLREHAAAAAPAEHLDGALTVVGGVRMAAGGAASGIAGMASGVSLGSGMTSLSAGTGTGSTGMGVGMGMGVGGQEQQAQPNYSPAPSLMSEGALDVLFQQDYHGRFSPLMPGAQAEGEGAVEPCMCSPACTVATGAREGLARLASSASLLPRWTDGPDTDDTDGQGQSVPAMVGGSNDAIYGPLNTEEEEEAAGLQAQKGAFALPPLPPSVGSTQSAQTQGQNTSARSSAPVLFSPRRFIAAKLEDYGYTPAKEEEEEEGRQEGEDHTSAPSNCENSAPEPALTSPGGRKALATTLFLSPASMALGSTHAAGTGNNNGGTLALAGTKLLMDQPEDEYSHSTALVVSCAGGGPQAGSLQALMQQLGIDALEERIAKLMQTVNTPIA